MDDLISRQEAVKGVKELFEFGDHYSDKQSIVGMLNSLPSVQPIEDKYEYHYDHTDCIWYRPEAKNRCPVTCAQYRDGWNDAMNYIYHDGDGYRPYRRGERYE